MKDGVLEMANSIGDPVSQLNSSDAYTLISYVCNVGVPIPPAPMPTPPSPSHLPLTGGKGVPSLSLASASSSFWGQSAVGP